MGDDHHKPPPTQPGGVVTFVSRLCVIAWICAISFELLPRGPLKSLCLLFGSHAAALGLVTGFIFWLLRRQALLFLLIVATAPPVAYFGVVIWNIVKARHSID
ncbi:MAG: hypothetical protein AABP62_13515 [Planctomycetota bacterium]